MNSRIPIIKSYRRQGYNDSQIAKRLGISRQRINQIMNPLKNYARQRVAILKRKPCEYPDCSTEKTEAHHYDYTEPLEVIWLCIKHHKKLHVALRGNDVPKTIVEFKTICIICKKELEYKKRKPKFCRDCFKKHTNKLHRRAYHNSPAQKAKQLEATKKWRENNKEKVAAMQKRASKTYYEKHKDELNAKSRYYYQKKKMS